MSAQSNSATVEYLATTTIGEKGQLTVPKEFRDDLGLGPGAPFAVLRLGDGLILLPEQRRFERLCDSISSALAHAGVHRDDLLAALPKARKRVLARHYGVLASKAAYPPRRKGRAYT
jgi:AbrB family looped-hinge helix DNA binding protein